MAQIPKILRREIDRAQDEGYVRGLSDGRSEVITQLVGGLNGDGERVVTKALLALITKAKDASGHEHRGEGPGGGQFTSGPEGGGDAKKPAAKQGAPDSEVKNPSSHGSLASVGKQYQQGHREVLIQGGQHDGQQVWRWAAIHDGKWKSPVEAGPWQESEEDARQGGRSYGEEHLGVAKLHRVVSELKPEDFDSAESVERAMISALTDDPTMEEDDIEERTEAVKAVVAKLTPGALARLPGKIREIHAYQSLDDIEKGWSEKTGELNSKGVQAFYSPTQGRLSIDGGSGLYSWDEVGEDQNAIAGIYAHELGHAIDAKRGGNFSLELSSSPDFKKCFAAEIEAGQLSKYAATDPVEGFAEFCRLLYGSDIPRQKVEAKFPKTLNFFKGHGLA